MLFNSFDYLIFFPVVVVAYFAIPHRHRWKLLLVASYYFYMSWKAEYVLLIVCSTGVDYWAGLRMGTAPDRSGRRVFLGLSLASNLGLLFAFKYANFFNDSFRAVLEQFSIGYHAPAFDVLLPVGISFYTFQTLSYTIDVYRGDREPERHLGIFALYVSFFPQLVAGPIERSTRLLPQFLKEHALSYERVADGLQLILWGLFKKLVIADRLAIYVDRVYAEPGAYQGLPIWIATYFFAFQIYCDFSGYSDIAVGSGKVLGFDIMDNFNRPYSARTIRDFWRRWHISLSTWFRDYVYLPLGGNRVKVMRWYVNLFIVFTVSGLWHGAAWNFVIWGALHGLFLISAIASAPLRDRIPDAVGLRGSSPAGQAVQVMVTFHLVLLAWVFFRAASFTDAMLVFSGMVDFSSTTFTLEALNVAYSSNLDLALAVLLIAFMEAVQLMQARGNVRGALLRRSPVLRWSFYYALASAVVFLGVFQHVEFIYFQF